jgi:hypothetical protein
MPAVQTPGPHRVIRALQVSSTPTILSHVTKKLTNGNRSSGIPSTWSCVPGYLHRSYNLSWYTTWAPVHKFIAGLNTSNISHIPILFPLKFWHMIQYISV